MSQSYDYSKPVFETVAASAEVRDNFQALSSSHSGDTEPPTIVEGMLWLKTTLGITVQRRGVAWFYVSGQYIHTQIPDNVQWVIPHQLEKQYPNIVIVLSTGDIVLADSVEYTNKNNLKLNFTEAVHGVAYIN